MHKGMILVACLVLLCLASTSSFASEAIERKYQEMGGPTGPLGVPVTPEAINPDGVGRRQHYAHGSIYWSPTTGAYVILPGPFWDTWAAYGWEQGLGYPMTDEIVNPDSVGRRQHFQHGHIYWSPYMGAYAISAGPIWDTWAAHGWEQGILGYPTSDAYSDPLCGADGRRSDFENAYFCWTPTEAKVVAHLTGDTTCLYGAAQCNRCVHNAENAVSRLRTGHSSTIGFGSNTGEVFQGILFPEMKCSKRKRECDHMQGIGRVPGVAGETWIVGTVSHPLVGSGHAGFFLANVFDNRVGIDGKGGEAFDHNDPQRGFRSTFRETKFWYPMKGTDHAGGLQMLGKTLVVSAHCTRDSACRGNTFVDFYDLSQLGIQFRQHRLFLDGSQGEHNQYPPGSSHNGRATASAVVRLANGRYLMFVLGDKSLNGWLYLSDMTSIHGSTRWHYLQEWTAGHVLPHAQLWRGEPQNVNFITDCATGDIYVVALGNAGFIPEVVPIVPTQLGQQIVSLYRLIITEERFYASDPSHGTLFREANGPAIRFELISSKELHERWCTLRAGGSTHVTPSGELVVYCSSYQVVPGDNLVVEEWSP